MLIPECLANNINHIFFMMGLGGKDYFCCLNLKTKTVVDWWEIPFIRVLRNICLADNNMLFALMVEAGESYIYPLAGWEKLRTHFHYDWPAIKLLPNVSASTFTVHDEHFWVAYTDELLSEWWIVKHDMEGNERKRFNVFTELFEPTGITFDNDENIWVTGLYWEEDKGAIMKLNQEGERLFQHFPFASRGKPTSVLWHNYYLFISDTHRQQIMIYTPNMKFVDRIDIFSSFPRFMLDGLVLKGLTAQQMLWFE